MSQNPSQLRRLKAAGIHFLASEQAAFAHGMYTIAIARPVHLAFEVDRMRVVTAADIKPDSLRESPPQFRAVPWCGPTRVIAVKPAMPQGQLRSIDLGLADLDLSMIPANRPDYASQDTEVWAKEKPVHGLTDSYPESGAGPAEIAAASGLAVADLRVLPSQSRQASGVTLVAAPGGRIVGHVRVDGFF